jgi:hypothetical protein
MHKDEIASSNGKGNTSTSPVTMVPPPSPAEAIANNDIVIEKADKDEWGKEDKKNKESDEKSNDRMKSAPAAAPKNEETQTKETLGKSYSNKKARARSEEPAKEKGYETNAPQSAADMEMNMATAPLSNISDSVYTIVDEMPEYPGGKIELGIFVRKNIPHAGTDDQGNAYVVLDIQFIINTEGKAIEAKLLNPQNKKLEKDVIEVVDKMPLWKPGKNKGKIVSVQCNLSIKFGIR